MYTKDGMRDYVGRFRVCCDFDRKTLEPIKGETWIKCRGDAQIYRYDDEKLGYSISGVSQFLWKKKFEALEINLYRMECVDGEFSVLFKESDLDKVIPIVKPMTYGAGITPYTKRNLRLQMWSK